MNMKVHNYLNKDLKLIFYVFNHKFDFKKFDVINTNILRENSDNITLYYPLQRNALRRTRYPYTDSF